MAATASSAKSIAATRRCRERQEQRHQAAEHGAAALRQDHDRERQQRHREGAGPLRRPDVAAQPVPDGNREADAVHAAHRIRIEHPVEGRHALEPAVLQHPASQRGPEQHRSGDGGHGGDRQAQIARERPVVALGRGRKDHAAQGERGLPKMVHQALFPFEFRQGGGKEQHRQVAGEPQRDHEEEGIAPGLLSG
jgi:hypothetical protein